MNAVNRLISAAGAAVRIYLIPVLAIGGVVMAAVTVVNASRPVTPVPPIVEPPKAPYNAFVAGSGIVETSTQNIAVGTPVPGVVQKVAVQAGDPVKAGDVLFVIDAREIQALLVQREAALASKRAALVVAQAKVSALKAYPRPESLPPEEAKVAEATATLGDMQSQLDKYEAITDRRAISDDDLTRRRFAVETAKARLAAAKAELELTKSGTFKPEIDSAAAQALAAESDVAAAQADVEAMKIELDRRTIRASVSGRILQVNVRPGEYAQAGVLSTPLMLMGQTEPLYVRVDVDENEAWRVKGGSNATAFLRGNAQFKTPIKFVRFEPYIVPKKSLTGDSTERVDTRVLQILFSFEKPEFPLYVGQQMDVYIEADPTLRASSPAADKSQSTPKGGA